jgi:hypothetical protein
VTVTKDPRKLLLVGDLHGNTAFAKKCFERGSERKVDALFQLGDFGYWEHEGSGQRYLKDIERLIQEYQIPLYWLDGNHENHRLLKAKYGWMGLNMTTEGVVPAQKRSNNEFWPMGDELYYSPRGHRFTWSTVTFMTLGGAASVDKNWRTLCADEYPFGGSYWPEEAITAEEEVYASRFEGPHVNVILSHDSPMLPPEVADAVPNWSVYEDSMANRAAVARVVEALTPRRLYHGHYHYAYSAEFNYNGGFVTKVRGLDADVNYDVDGATQFIGLSRGAVHEA